MLTVPTGITLTIEPGTTLFFDSDAGIDVRGRIVAEGSQYSRIRWTRVPTANDPWQGVEILDSPQDNALKYIDQDYADDQGWSINIDNSRVIIDHMTWSGVTDTTLELSDPMLIVRNSHFPGTASAEVIHGTGSMREITSSWMGTSSLTARAKTMWSILRAGSVLVPSSKCLTTFFSVATTTESTWMEPMPTSKATSL
jgi:hypothetical protein